MPGAFDGDPAGDVPGDAPEGETPPDTGEAPLEDPPSGCPEIAGCTGAPAGRLGCTAGLTPPFPKSEFPLEGRAETVIPLAEAVGRP